MIELEVLEGTEHEGLLSLQCRLRSPAHDLRGVRAYRDHRDLLAAPDIDAFERRYGVRLPADVRAFYAEADGMPPGAWDEELGVKDVTWLTPAAQEMTEANWNDPLARCLGVLLDGRAQETGIRKNAEDATVLLILNGFDGVVDFTLPKVPHGDKWQLLIDTNIPDAEPGEEFGAGSVYQVTARSVLLFGLADLV